jgi:alpha-L-fucosidase
MDTKDYPAIAQDHFYLAGHGDTAGRYWMPAMGDAPLRGYNGRHEWFWEPDDESHIFPLQNLLDMYDQSVGRNATLILGLTPDTAGLMPAADSLRLSAFGEAIHRRFDHPLATAKTANTAKTAKGTGDTLAINLETRQPVNQLVIAEHIVSGERVRSFAVQALVRGKWRKIDTGSAIGHKYIRRLGVPVTAKKFRLIITRSTDKPIIDQFSVYNEE